MVCAGISTRSGRDELSSPPWMSRRPTKPHRLLALTCGDVPRSGLIPLVFDARPPSAARSGRPHDEAGTLRGASSDRRAALYLRVVCVPGVSLSEGQRALWVVAAAKCGLNDVRQPSALAPEERPQRDATQDLYGFDAREASAISGSACVSSGPCSATASAERGNIVLTCW